MTEKRDDRSLFEAIVETIREPLLVLDAGLRVLSANRSFYAAFRCRPDDTLQKFIYDLGNGQWDIPELRTLLEEIIPRDSFFNDYEVTHNFPEIGTRVMILNARRLSFSGKGNEHILLAFEDITAGKKLRESEARFRFMVEGVKEYAIILMNESGVVTEWNPGAERLLGFKESEAAGKFADFFFTEEDRQADLARWELDQARKEGCASDERWHRKKDGSRFWGSGTVTPFYNDKGALIGFVKVFRDMTSYKKMTEALEKSNEALEHFASVASHDLQEPLRVVSMYTDLLMDHYEGKTDEDASQYFTYIREGVTRAQHLVHGLLEYSRLGRVWNLEPVRTEDVLTQSIFNLKAIIEQNKAAVSYDKLPETITGDKVSLLRLFQNLISNAVKYHGNEPPRVHISCIKKSDAWLFSVKDNGIGIAPEYLPRIFKMFQRLHTASNYEGTGIGLAACKKIVEGHGGRIWVESKPGEGSTFLFTLPDAA